MFEPLDGLNKDSGCDICLQNSSTSALKRRLQMERRDKIRKCGITTITKPRLGVAKAWPGDEAPELQHRTSCSARRDFDMTILRKMQNTFIPTHG